MDKVSEKIGLYIKKIVGFKQNDEERKRFASVKIFQLEELEREEILAKSMVMEKMLSMADHVAKSDSTVLITGETGVGKELLAKRIHKNSLRRLNALTIVDLTSIPDRLMESELFGYEKGAFTGADFQKKGRIELAHKGTLFFDEIGEIPLSIQVKLLRTIQEKTFIRVGGTQMIASDFRLIAATNRNLEKEVAQGRFRQDLFFRLNVVPLELPPLRARGDDAVYIARNFVKYFTKQMNRPDVVLTAKDESWLRQYKWPGNIRELKNVIERAVLLSEDNRLALSLPNQKEEIDLEHPFIDTPSLDEIQRRYIRHVLIITNGKIGGSNGAAALLKMKRTTLNARIKKLGIQ